MLSRPSTLNSSQLCSVCSYVSCKSHLALVPCSVNVRYQPSVETNTGLPRGLHDTVHVVSQGQ